MTQTHKENRIAKAPRLFVAADLAAGAEVTCEPGQANYLVNVLRLRAGAAVRLFNGRDGEWLAEITTAKRGKCTLQIRETLRAQETPPDIDYLFAPLKKARLDYMVQKATEMGVAALRPVMTAYTVADRVNLERMRANAIEAAEQCNILWVPEVSEPQPLRAVLAHWPEERRLIFCDEAAPIASPVEALGAVAPGPLGVLVGPEGGFNAEERAVLRNASFAVPISLGPRVMRADTAAVAALALVNAVLGDWR
ncbi:16S rRNA (uracil(1498)-N(3))-methyltransferase [Dichotomicrobium thermohalophilum]|uniref:Ribosomal RNA small subunit methyltransferase E n=1 Tax=Dichotomicrobium thermohalophilum TaxID=933063 RepID=A0A397PEE9_9HYPH|nr:16S rRNA (uracil(1498)-N(3))-methyltransferase [Dichotomicrobium thermohalophilum]RIA47392.1 16S rRNA (uracil1498-N3)-methyltransferase [Dichotomicrobium thermohalophilum]